uniref:PsbP C-terminal domain-containing protein n=1 Tax=Arundo donax TaxID=35708 RepID=A0A0A9DZD6_ARUDO
MAAALLSPPPSLPSPTSPPSRHRRSRGTAGRVPALRRSVRVLASCPRVPASRNQGLKMEIERRRLLLSGIVSSFAVVLPIPESYAVMETDGDVKMNMQVDAINAYSFLYPVELPGKKFSFKWVESRKPERYSSAAPLSPDARQRIVSERVDMIHNVVISVSIGPPNSRFLPAKDKSKWDPKDVADCILADRSTLKVTTGQRMTESSVLDAHSTEVEGEPYWYYEYLVRKSPMKSAPEPNLFRHNVACTAERDGYLYSLNASTLSKRWESMGPFLQKTIASFRLLPPTENYVPPYKDPWRFW